MVLGAATIKGRLLIKCGYKLRFYGTYILQTEEEISGELMCTIAILYSFSFLYIQLWYRNVPRVFFL